MKRGEIYFIKRRDTYNIGAECPKSRPGVIVSSDLLNDNSEVVMVVYLTTHPKGPLPTHVCINSTGVPSTALCEQIDHVSTLLIGNYCGTCTDEEMAAIEHGMRVALDLSCYEFTQRRLVENPEPLSTEAHDTVNHPSHYTDGKIEVIDYIEDKKLSYHLGNAVKYISRAGKKDPTKKVEDLRKAAWYINREVERLTKEEIA